MESEAYFEVKGKGMNSFYEGWFEIIKGVWCWNAFFLFVEICY